MKILLVGATGMIGSAVAKALEAEGDTVVSAGHSSGQYTVDLADPKSVRTLIEFVGSLDAIVCTAGVAHFGAVEELSLIHI